MQLFVVLFQKLIEDYYDPKYHFNAYVKDLESERIIGDELTLVLLARYMKRNVSVMTPYNTWTLYPSLKQDIILVYDGRFSPIQDLSNSAAAQSKPDALLMRMFLNVE